jgi:hypothetical protein
MRHAFEVDQPTGERWDLALGLLARVESAVAIGNLILYRTAGGPTADGRLYVELRATTEPPSLTRARAEADIATGLGQLDQLLSHDHFAALGAEHGLMIEYVSDYDTGRVALAGIATDRSIIWQGDFEPRT